MQLDEFIKATLIQISNGVAEAMDEIAETSSGAVINPKWTHRTDNALTDPRPIDFDVAVTVLEENSASRGSSAKAGIGVLAVVGIGANIQSQTDGSSKREAISRVKFAVMMSQPGTIRRLGS